LRKPELEERNETKDCGVDVDKFGAPDAEAEAEEDPEPEEANAKGDKLRTVCEDRRKRLSRLGGLG